MENSVATILVPGANGKTGSRVVKRLETSGLPVRKGSRNATPAFNWEDNNTWAPALAGISGVYITYYPDLAADGAEAAISAFVQTAVTAGVQQLVLLSGRGEPEAQRCEQVIMQSGLRWTIVRASWFNQNFSEGHFLGPILAGSVALPAGDIREPFVDADDIADVVVASLTASGHDYKVYEVTGPRLLSFREAIGEIAHATNRFIEYADISLDQYVSMLREYEVPEDVIRLVSYLFSEVLDGRNASVTHGITEALGRAPKDFSEYVQDTAGGNVWLVE